MLAASPAARSGGRGQLLAGREGAGGGRDAEKGDGRASGNRSPPPSHQSNCFDGVERCARGGPREVDRRAPGPAPRPRGPPSSTEGAKVPAPGGAARRGSSSAASPAPIAASAATPRAVSSVAPARATRTPARSACRRSSRSLAAAPPSTRSSPAATPAVAISSSRSATWKAMASSAARARCARVEPAVSPVTRPRAAGSQSGAASPLKAGTKVTPPASGTDAASASTSAARSITPERVAQPAHHVAGHEHRPVQRVGRAPAEPPRHRRQQARRRRGALPARAGQHHGARAVGALGLAGGPRAVAEQRRLLVAGQRRDRHALGGLPHHAGRVHHGGQRPGGRAEARGEVGREGPCVEVEEQRARGVGGVGDVGRAAGQAVDEPAVDRPQPQRAGVGRAPHRGHVLEQPGQLRAGEGRVEQQAGASPQLVARARQPGAGLQPLAALPHQRPVQRAPRVRVPRHEGLGLVGDAQRGRLGRPPPRPARRAPRPRSPRRRAPRTPAPACAGRARGRRCAPRGARRAPARSARRGCPSCPDRAPRRSGTLSAPSTAGA